MALAHGALASTRGSGRGRGQASEPMLNRTSFTQQGLIVNAALRCHSRAAAAAAKIGNSRPLRRTLLTEPDRGSASVYGIIEAQ
jgi:hypothetical protein